MERTMQNNLENNNPIIDDTATGFRWAQRNSSGFPGCFEAENFINPTGSG